MGRTMTAVLILLALCSLTVGTVGCGGGTDTGSADGFVYVNLGDATSLILLALASDAPLGYTALAGATVTVKTPGGTVVTTTNTSALGYYLLENLLPGWYNFTISGPPGSPYTPKTYLISIVAGERTSGRGHTEGQTP